MKIAKIIVNLWVCLFFLCTFCACDSEEMKSVECSSSEESTDLPNNESYAVEPVPLEYNDNSGDLFKYGLLMIQNSDESPYYINVNGETVIENSDFGRAYGEESHFDRFNRAIVRLKNKKSIIIDTNGMIVSEEFDYYNRSISDNGYFPYKDNENLVGYRHIEDGRIVIEAQFDDVKEFAECGLAAVKKSDKWGYIDEQGKFVIEPQYTNASTFYNCGVAFVGEEKNYDCIDMFGNVLVSNIESYCYEEMKNCGYICIKKNGLYGAIDSKGDTVIDFLYDSSFDFDYYYEECEDGPDEYAWVQLPNTNYGLIDMKGNYIIEPTHNTLSTFFSYGLIVASDNSHRYYYINKNDEIVMEFTSGTKVGNFSLCGLAIYFVGDEYGFIDTTGNVVIEPQYKFAEPFYRSNFSVVTFKGGSRNIINTKGECLFENNYLGDDFGGLSQLDGTYCYHINGTYTVIDGDGDALIDGLDDYPTKFSNDGYAIITVNGKEGIVDQNYNIIVSTECDKIVTDFDDYV